MAHHGDDAEIIGMMAKMFADRAVNRPSDLGATGLFPEGKLNDDDEGEIRIAIGRQGNKVVIDFGKPVAWIGFTPKQALEIAEMLKEQAMPEIH